MKFCSTLGVSRSLRLLGLAFGTALLTVCLSLYGGRPLSFLAPATATIAPTTAADPLPNSPAIAPSSQAQRLLQQGREHYRADQFAAAITAWTEAEALFADQKDHLNQAIALSNLALAHRQLGQWPAAETAIQSSVRLLGPEDSLTAQGLRIYGQALNTQGSVYLAQGQAELALKAWEKATESYTQADYPDGIVKSLINQTHALRSLGFFRQSRDRLKETCNTLNRLTNSPLKVALTRSLGETQRLLGNPGSLQPSKKEAHACVTEAALQNEPTESDSKTTLNESLMLARELNHPLELAKTYISLGDTFRAIAQQQEILAQRTGQAHDKEKAVEGYQNALENYQAAFDVYEENATTMPLMISVRATLNQLETLWRLDKFEQAQPMLKGWDKAQLQKSLLARIDVVPASRSSIFAQIKLARLLMDLWAEKRLAQSPDSTQQIYGLLAAAKEQAERLKDSTAESYALGYLGHLYETGKRYEDAQRFTESALTLANQQPSIAYQWQWQLGRIEKELQPGTNQTRVLWYYDQAFQNIQAVRNDLLYLEPGVRFDFRDRTEKLYREYISLLLPEKGPEKAEDITLSSALIQAKTVINDLRVAELESFLACGLLEPNSPIEQVSIEAIVNKDKNTAIVYPIILPNGPEGERLEVLIQLPGQDDKPVIKRYPSKLLQEPNPSIESELKAFRQALERPYFSDREGLRRAKDIYEWLIRPAERAGWFSSIDTLVFVLDGAFRNVPMAALYDKEASQFLIEKYAIAVTFGDLQVPDKPPAKSFTVLAAGLSKDPKPFSENETDIFGPLDYVEAEIQAIKAAIDNTDPFLDAQFTEKEVKANMRSSAYNIVHLATHGVFGFTRNETYLLAADPDSSNQTEEISEGSLDGERAIAVEKINLNQFDNLLKTRNRIPIELLVLSACETATGDEREVLGIAGLAVQSGAQSTLAGLWSINDLSTARIMEGFYQTLQHSDLSKAKALQQAQVQLIQEGLKPSRWAPYILISDWR